MWKEEVEKKRAKADEAESGLIKSILGAAASKPFQYLPVVRQCENYAERMQIRKRIRSSISVARRN